MLTIIIANHYGTCLYQNLMFIPQCSNIASNSCGQPAALLTEGNMRLVIHPDCVFLNSGETFM